MGDGERERFELLYAEHYDRVLAYALCRATVDGAREAAAETFAVAWRRRADPPGDPLPWLIGVARRCLADQRRSTGRRHALAVRLREEAEAASVWDDDPAEAVTARDQVAGAMQRLAPPDREILRLVAWDGLTPAQAAQSLQCSRATFAVRLHRARRRLVIALEAEEAVDAQADAVPHPQPPSSGVRMVGAIRSGDGAVRFGGLSVPASTSLSTPSKEAS